MPSDRRLESLRALKRLLDEAFVVPGTNLRFGWDPIVGLIPWAGDLLTALLSCGIILQAHHLRVPKVVQLRMLFNVAIDLLAGIVPVFGDLADFAWKANTRNMALLERHAAELTPATPGDWLFVSAMLTAVILIALVPIAVAFWIGRSLYSAL